MIRKSSKKSSSKSAAKPAIAPQASDTTAALDEQELNKVTGGSDTPTESVSLNFGQIKHQ